MVGMTRLLSKHFSNVCTFTALIAYSDRDTSVSLSLVVELAVHKFERFFIISTNKKTSIKEAFLLVGMTRLELVTSTMST